MFKSSMLNILLILCCLIIIILLSNFMKSLSMFDEHAPPWNVGRAALFTHWSTKWFDKICYAWSILECENIERNTCITWNICRFITFFRYFVFKILNIILWSSMATMQFISPSLEAKCIEFFLNICQWNWKLL